MTGTYAYQYDAGGNRLFYSTTITASETITYVYDQANRLTLSRNVLSGEVTTYDWDNASRLITTTVAGQVTRVYTYTQAGDMVAALVEGTLSTFDYDGDGHRLRMAVAGEVTTYTLDYAGGFRVLLEEGGAFSDTKHYLYGLTCIGEHVNAGEVDNEWRFYQRDGSSLVRQTTNMQATVTLAWTYSPEGAVLLGEEGPVTNLDCSGNTIYDFSTGLIFKNGKYFDPNTGIWVTMGGLVFYQGGWLPYGKRRKWGKDRKRLVLLFLLLMFGLILAGCGPEPLPVISTPITPTCTPTSQPWPTGWPTHTPTPQPWPTGWSTPETPLAPTASSVPPTDTPDPSPTPEIEWLPEIFTITHYTFALESDPLYENDRRVSANGLPPDRLYKEGFLYGARGILLQGTGLAEDGEYITIDWINGGPQGRDTYFTYGIGGNYGTPIAWETGASGDPRLFSDAGEVMVIIEEYQDLGAITINDTGGGVGRNHIDLFIGTVTIEEADQYGTISSRVGIIRE